LKGRKERRKEEEERGEGKISFENERRRRMTRILELLRANPQGLDLRTIAKETDVLLEITKNRLELYLQELIWCGKVVRGQDGKYRLKR